MADINFESKEYFEKMDKYFRATNYLSVAQLYLLDNPLLREPLAEKHIKKKIVGHWGTCPGQNFVYTHCNRVINKYDLNMMLISGPGHGGNFFVANSYLEGVYSEVYPKVSQDKEGMTKLCKQFSFPGGISSHVAPETPGSIHEGGELGYSLFHAFGAVFDNKDLIVTTIIGDGEAETGPLASSWQSNKFLNPVTDGAVLPILHLNGYKIANPSVLARISKNELKCYLYGCGWSPIFVEGNDPMSMHKQMAKAMDRCVEKIKAIQKVFRENGATERPIWPMIVLRTPKGWTGPKFVNGKMIENSFRAHQVPITMARPEHIYMLEEWLRSYKPEELFDENYKLKSEIAEILPKGDKRISACPQTNPGISKLNLPVLKDYAVEIEGHGQSKAQDMLELGRYIKDVFALNRDNKNFRVFCPDEAMSNRLYHIFYEESRNFNTTIYPTDEFLTKDGRIMDSYLSEHACEGWLEGYLLTGRHGVFATYEAFVRIVDSMVSQHAKWLKVCNELPWRKPISSLNLLLTSNVWQQDHNGYTHQEPGFLDHVANKKSDITRIYLPPDANTLLSVYDHCQASQNYINVIIASKHPTYQWLNMNEAIEHCSKGLGEWEWASTCPKGKKPDVVIACAGDTPTIEALATVSLLKEYLPKVKVRFVNVVDMMKLEPADRHPHGLSDEEFDEIFTKDRPVIFNFHGYPKFIYDQMVTRHNKKIYVHGYNEEGTITTSFDMRVQNKIDRYNLVLEIIDKLKLKDKEDVIKIMKTKLANHKRYIARFGVDMPEVTRWKWQD